MGRGDGTGANEVRREERTEGVEIRCIYVNELHVLCTMNFV